MINGYAARVVTLKMFWIECSQSMFSKGCRSTHFYKTWRGFTGDCGPRVIVRRQENSAAD